MTDARPIRGRGRRSARDLLVSGLVGALTLAALTGPTADAAPRTSPGAPAATQVVAPVPELAWRPCRLVPGVQCAKATVPLDYDDPTGPTTQLDLLRVPAIEPAERIGTIFVNPGGPGGEARSFAAFVTGLLPPNVSRSFDVVGIDPRGVGRRTPAVCRGAKMPDTPFTAFPVGDREIRATLRYSRWLSRACRQHPAPIVNHLSTADVARDMDLIRQAQGDEQLNYIGISYGTYLGATYAAMFPDRVRTMVLDGVLDPVAWATGTPATGGTQPFSRRVGSGDGSWTAMKSALAECDRVGRARCAFAGDSLDKWKQITRSLETEPFDIGGKDSFPITYAEVIGGTTGALYDARAVRILMRLLDWLHRKMFADARSRTRVAADPDLQRSRDQVAAQLRRVSRQGSFGGVFDPFSAIACADTTNPDDARAWISQARKADRSAPGFGSLWTWASSPCAGWSSVAQQDRYTGPFTISTAIPALVVANTHDPATPIKGARALADLWAGSRLLTLDTWGHGSLLADCVAKAYAAYLLRGELPPVGEMCQPARPLF